MGICSMCEMETSNPLKCCRKTPICMSLRFSEVNDLSRYVNVDRVRLFTTDGSLSARMLYGFFAL